MALLFIDSFDHYATADIFLGKWLSAPGGGMTIQPSSGRRGGGAMRSAAFNSDMQTPALPASGSTAIVGAAVQASTLATGRDFLRIALSGAAQASVAMNTSGFLQAYRGPASGGTLLGTATTGALAANTYYYVELKVVIHPSTGSIVVRVNEAEVLNLTGQNTQGAGSAAWNQVFLNATSANFVYFDDLYVLDGAGSAPLNDLLGDCRVDARYPTGAGATTGWTPSTGANWQNVDDTAPNGDTDYNSTSTVGATDTFAMQDAPVPGALLYGVQLVINHKKSDAGTCAVAPVLRHSGVDYPGTAFNPSTSYAYRVVPYDTNPGTGAAWTEAGFNAIEAGYKRTA